MFSSFAAWRFASFTSRNFPCRKSAISRALRSSPRAIISSPAFGTSERPWISTGIDGPASDTGRAFSSSIDRSLQLQHLGLQQHPLEEIVNPLAGLRRDRDERRVAAIFLGHHALRYELLL